MDKTVKTYKCPPNITFLRHTDAAFCDTVRSDVIWMIRKCSISNKVDSWPMWVFWRPNVVHSRDGKVRLDQPKGFSKVGILKYCSGIRSVRCRAELNDKVSVTIQAFEKIDRKGQHTL
jgi:hypothetical protein